MGDLLVPDANIGVAPDPASYCDGLVHRTSLTPSRRRIDPFEPDVALSVPFAVAECGSDREIQ
jgi:hypothetical protein